MVDERSVVDRNWVSSRQPTDIPEFNRNMLKLFAEEKQKGRRAA
jgi:protease I